MRNDASRQHRVNRVVNFVRAHLEDEFDLDRMAQVACLSKYHFSRVFEQKLGESPTRFVTRLRLERAARALIRPSDRSITNIGFDCGYSNPEVFSHAFRRYFGASPKHFRHSQNDFRLIDTARHVLTAYSNDPRHCLRTVDLSGTDVRIERRPDFPVAYIRHVGPYGDMGRSISLSFQKVQRWAEQREILYPDTSFLGVCLDNPLVTPPDRCIYDTALVLHGPVPEDDTVSIQTIPGGLFAVLHVVCPPAQLRSRWRWFVDTWLPASGWRGRYDLSYEFFQDVGYAPISAEYGVDLCIPIERKAV